MKPPPLIPHAVRLRNIARELQLPDTATRAQVETAINLATWQAGAGAVQQVGSPVPNGDGTETVKVRVIAPVSADTVRFIRLRVIVAD